MTAFRAIQTAVVEMLTAEELRHLAEARDMIERRRADDHVDHLARVMWDKPALGAYRQDHRPPSCPPDSATDTPATNRGHGWFGGSGPRLLPASRSQRERLPRPSPGSNRGPLRARPDRACRRIGGHLCPMISTAWSPTASL